MKPPATYTTIDEYIAAFPADVQKVLQKVRKTVRKAAPAATERISYNMPTFSLGKDIIHFGAFKQHIGLYPPVRDPELLNRVAIYRGEKGNLRFPLDRPIPYDLIADIVKVRMKACSGKAGTRE